MRTVVLTLALLTLALVPGCRTRAEKQQVCDKCAACKASEPSFQEDFCDPWWDGSTFDTVRCVSDGEDSLIEGFVSSTEIDDISCEEFDDEI